MIVPADLLAGLQRLLKRLEPDIRTRCKPGSEIDARLRAEYEKARSASRTAQAYEVWQEDYITQVAVAWILACVFVRFLEDNRLIDIVWLAGPDDRLQLARDQHEIYFQANPTHSDREYLEHVFQEVAKLPSMRELLDGSHNPISKLGPTGDGAHELLEFWQKVDPSTGAILRDFSDPGWSTRFLGDLYQDLSESARKRYALLQTPEFVEEFILDRTLIPAIQDFGYAAVRIIDPACGSGHFLLGAFERLLRLWVRHEPSSSLLGTVQRVLDAIYGVDLNPFAAAIARFRLLLACLKTCNVRRLANAPAFHINIAVGDSLLHGPKLGRELDRLKYLEGMDPLQHVYDTEDADDIRRILGQRYHAVVGNPPYITVSDHALNKEYRRRFGSCHRQYSLAVPFMERFFDLAIEPSGYVGMITANSFMKREFGKKLVEDYISHWDITHVIDTAGAYIPGHGTPTVVIFGRHRKPVQETIRTVMGIRGEPQTPSDPARGLVWSAILEQVDAPGSQSAFVRVADTDRAIFRKHPWSIGGGGAAELKARLDSACTIKLGSIINDWGFQVITGEDNCFILPLQVAERKRLDSVKPLGTGDDLRDWVSYSDHVVVWPVPDTAHGQSEPSLRTLQYLWPYRTTLRNRKLFGVPIEEQGLPWWRLRELYADKLQPPMSIAFAFVATHNQFVLDRGGRIFKQSAPVIKLASGASEIEHFDLMGLLNSSIACFWIKQVAQNKGSTVDERGARQRTAAFEDFFEHEGIKLQRFPIPHEKPSGWAPLLGYKADELKKILPSTSVFESVPTRLAFCTFMQQL